RTSPARVRFRLPLARLPVPPAGPGGLEPLLAQLRRCLAGEDRDPAARLRQRSLEDFGFHRGAGVLHRGLAAPAVLGDTGAGRPAVLTDVLVAGSPDARFEFDS